MKQYLVNEIFYTIQGEGRRWGIPHVFVRFAKCNLSCNFCDTEFESFTPMTAQEILLEVLGLTKLKDASALTVDKSITRKQSITRTPCNNVMLCGGEPLLQADSHLINTFKKHGFFIATETNGTCPIPEGIDWVACSPKVAEHAIKPKKVNELKYVRAVGQNIPRPICKADHYLISPMFDGDVISEETLKWCLELVQDNPQWELTVQHHKISFGGIR